MSASGTQWLLDDAKITLYLLSDATEKSRSRLRFLTAFGFDPQFPGILRAACLDHPRSGRHVVRPASAYGEHLNVRGPLSTPDQRNPVVTTCWTRRGGEDAWRFTTLLPR